MENRKRLGKEKRAQKRKKKKNQLKNGSGAHVKLLECPCAQTRAFVAFCSRPLFGFGRFILHPKMKQFFLFFFF